MRACTGSVLAMVLSVCVPTGQDLDRVNQWGRWERTLAATESATADTVVTISLEAPSGTGHVIEGFWDGKNLWKVRFIPDESGSWTYRTSSKPPVPGLDGETGSFAVSAAKNPPTPFLKHGAVQVSSDGRHLAHADSTPFFWLADTAWNGALKST